MPRRGPQPGVALTNKMLPLLLARWHGSMARRLTAAGEPTAHELRQTPNVIFKFLNIQSSGGRYHLNGEDEIDPCTFIYLSSRR